MNRSENCILSFWKRFASSAHYCRAGCVEWTFCIARFNERSLSPECRWQRQTLSPLRGRFYQQSPVYRLRQCGMPELPWDDCPCCSKYSAWLSGLCAANVHCRIILSGWLYGTEKDVWHIRNKVSGHWGWCKSNDDNYFTFVRLQLFQGTDGRYCVLCQYLPSVLCFYGSRGGYGGSILLQRGLPHPGKQHPVKVSDYVSSPGALWEE